MNDSIHHEDTLRGRAYLVTGGGSGIGFACASRLVADGAAVTICGRDAVKLEAAVARIGAASPGGQIRAVAGDVTVEADVRKIVAAALEATGQCIGVDGGQSLRRGPDYTSFVEMIHGPDILKGPVS